jgi:formylglycine-generating enzyme required for sulfatase activity
MLYHLLAVRELEMPYVPKGARMSARSVHACVIQGAPTALGSLAPKAPAELLAIIEKAMSRDVATRYRDMEALAADLRAYIEGRVVSAYETGSWAEAKKWVQRNKPLTAAAAAAVLALLGGIAFSWNFALDADAQRRRADEQRLEADAQRAIADAERGRTERANTALNEKVAELKAQSREQQLRGLAQELARFRAQCRTTEGLARLGKPAWQWWLDEADRLLDGREEDVAQDIEWSPGRKDVQAKLAELRERALPWSDADKAKDIAAHPAQRKIRQLELERFRKLAELRNDVIAALRLPSAIAYLEHRLAARPWPSESDVAAKYAEQLADADSSALNSAAWQLVDPDESLPDAEQLVLACLLARRGVELAPNAESANVRDTLAWSLVRLGRGDEALAMSDSAIAVAGEKADELRSSKERMQVELAKWNRESLAEREAELAELRRQLAALPSQESLEQALPAKEAAVNAEYEPRRAMLRSEAENTRATWRFERSEDEWWHAQLAELETELAWLESMRAAAHEANRSERAQRLWAEAIEGISLAPKYAGQRWPSGERLTPQAGLLPLGENPATGLWEFVHLQSGTEPVLGADGRVQRSPEGHLTLTPETGMVLVLLPGGRVPKADSAKQNQQDWITSVDLAPFFLSKYELTAEQWDRLSLRRGCSYTDGKSLTPANTISWDDITLMWPRELGWCDFPSEMQWEYGCRAGTTSTWWTGEDEAVLNSEANLGDDIAPTGGLRANAFGLHNVHGNVWEWCGDTYRANARARVGDGLRDDGVASSASRSGRGGTWDYSPGYAGSALRYSVTPEDRSRFSGLRPSRRITP